ncbi:MAG TPA: tripartite tricarboxylate transporter substrate-binding protein [Candidatus Limnocylindrales bacterium]|nr:tripartite tricarboxylate transporter substrate-binding protein [Candidatus Limnocylindrales bacterium]
MQKIEMRILALVILSLQLHLPVMVEAQENFYAGKTIRIIVGTSAGGGFDTYTRTIARHFGKHIRGQPSIQVENMAGAGHLIAANHMYKVAKPDGLTIGHFHGGWFLYQLFKRPGIEFDAVKFEFLGSPIKESRACAFTKASGITSVERWLAAKSPVKVGGIGGGAPDDIANMLAATTALPIQLVAGYKGTSEIRLAAESGELAGGCWTWDSIRSTWSKAIQSGEAIVVLQAVSKPHPELPNVPLAQSLAKTEEARQLMQAGIQDPADYYRPYVAPPRTPKARVETLRRAFEATMKDPEFLADAQKAKLDIEPITGSEMEIIVGKLFNLSPATAAKLNNILGAK